MTDLQRAKENLAGHSIALCRGDRVLTSDKRGISPMLDWIQESVDLKGWSAADIIVGKAAALLFAFAGISEVYAKVLSVGGARALEAHGIPYSYDTLVQNIVNRKGDGVCPMEKTVECICDPASAVAALTKKRDELRSQAGGPQ